VPQENATFSFGEKKVHFRNELFILKRKVIGEKVTQNCTNNGNEYFHL